MHQYHDLLRHILDHGVQRDDRTGTGTLAVFGHQMRFPLASPARRATPRDPDGSLVADTFPLITTKKLHTKSIVHELLWFLRGSTNARELHDLGVTIWDEWADPHTGELGPVYGHQWRKWPAPTPADPARTIDQIASLVHGLRTNPSSRRHLVTAWNPADLHKMKLPPCHCLFQFFVAPAGPAHPPVLSCQLYQRSADVFLGVPFNIASYALLTLMLCHVLDYAPGDFILTLGDAHLYLNHREQAQLQLTRDPRPLPTLRLSPEPRTIDDFLFDHIKFDNYDPHPAIKAPIAV